MSGKREIVCPNCKQWTLWRGEIYDRCLHCNAFLLPQEYPEKIEKEIADKVERENSIFFIRPTDGLLMRIFRRALSYLQIAFVAFISFILWLISLLAG